jgi:uncharacterized membrane protein YgaE (UPF0421/DUF939 family)
MARTHQKRTRRTKDVRRPLRLPERRRVTPRRSVVSKILRGTGIFLLCVLASGMAFAGGG